MKIVLNFDELQAIVTEALNAKGIDTANAEFVFDNGAEIEFNALSKPVKTKKTRAKKQEQEPEVEAEVETDDEFVDTDTDIDTVTDTEEEEEEEIQDDADDSLFD